jgi:hypothetical protein
VLCAGLPKLAETRNNRIGRVLLHVDAGQHRALDLFVRSAETIAMLMPGAR